MRIFRIIAVVAIATILSGCWVLSIEPLYTSEDLVFDPSLVGIWGEPDSEDEETWTFFSRDNKTYRLITTEVDSPDAVFEVHMLRLGDRLFLDILPEEPGAMNEFQLGHLIPAHSFWTVSLEGQVLVLNTIDTDRIREMIDSTGIDVAYLQRDHAIVLTSQTEELQGFIREHIEEIVTDEPLVLERIH